jgi:uncharacterized protein (TIGR02145 family)
MKKWYVLAIVVFSCISAFAQNQSIKVEAGWNLLSLPVIVADGRKNSLFPTAISDAFIYENSYQPKDTLENGFGFWLKFGSAETITITGNIILEDTIEVNAGWNIIGSLTVPVAVNTITSDPSGIITSQFFGYNSAGVYQETDTIQPGKGYWVKVNENGKIILIADSIGTFGKPCPSTPTVTYEGKTYNTVQVGNQCWLRENLDVGTRIDGSQDQTNNSTIEKYCYNNNPANCTMYGGLYQWNEIMQYTTIAGTQGICPSGWHIPTCDEFQTLKTAVGSDGNALKEIGQGSGDGAGTNISGFSALLAGDWVHPFFFLELGYYAYFCSSTFIPGYGQCSLELWYDSRIVFLIDNPLDDGFSVRCVKD